ncbi:Polyadenylate-binding protein RBP45C [Babesia microti strain RI]|uniref:Polyadenylate-binding protein RBP45C n=1 Tax=Babesia microti (strain RI) TaxID=1133968 RepID=A0A1R4A9Z7_BABMR|nr:Polyadenylate-binding protein RBP45C [Babesia microti strain RI]SJK85841.1 Polyadenylate-binding protein RBP45C [Babesia microti strain RI]|eukprot:XP_021338057.1 Polyadenylate-binding protein RBP45C [Babesia microti strain RI]
MEYIQAGFDENTILEGYHLYIGNLPEFVGDKELLILVKCFSKYVSAARIVKSESTGTSYGYGFVKYHTDDEAMAAYNSMKGACVKGNPIVVCLVSTHTKYNRIRNPEIDEPLIHSSSIYINNVAPEVPHSEWESIFRRFGETTYVNVIAHKKYGFVTYSKRLFAIAAMCHLNGCLVGGLVLNCTWAKDEQADHKGYVNDQLEMDRDKLDENLGKKHAYDLLPKKPLISG